MFEWHHRLNGHGFEQTLGDGGGQGSLACCSPWGCKESDMTWWLNNTTVIFISINFIYNNYTYIYLCTLYIYRKNIELKIFYEEIIRLLDYFNAR